MNDSSTLSWTTEGATTVVIDNGIGAQPVSGSVTVKPTTTTIYTLTANQGNTTLTQTVRVEVLTAAVINVTSFPSPMVQPQGSAGATTTYGLRNSGGVASSITLSQSGGFFTQSPATLSLAPGATQLITITAKALPAGAFEGASIPTGAGVPVNLQIPVKLLSSAPITGTVTADAASNRVDVAAPAATNPTGSVVFTNNGTATLTGVLSSDVPWIIPQTGVITIAPGATVTLTFTIDRLKRPDADALVGSAQGNLSLTFLSSQPLSKGSFDTLTGNISVELVKVVDTVQTPVAPADVPALAAGEVALFVPGVGHVTRSGRLFSSDVSLLNPQGARSLDDLKLYYSALSGNGAPSQSTTLPPAPANVSIALADAAKNIFGANEQIGTLHVRSKDAARLSVGATLVAAGNPGGALGTDLPVLRSDRAAAAGQNMVLTGLQKGSTAHTDLYVQETAGSTATVQIEYLGADGSTIGTPQSVSVEPFKLLEILDAVPNGAVSAILTNGSVNAANVLAYAVLSDEVSKDTWIALDWSRQLAYAPTEAVIIPIAGNLRGANNTFYRTDVAIMNRGTGQGSGTLRYIARTGEITDKQISLASRQTTVISDVIGTFFNSASAGFLTFQPSAGSFAITSRTFNMATGQSGAFSAATPVLAISSALLNGGSRIIGSLEDADRRTLSATRPGTSRTNFALMETSGKTVTVRVTLRFTFPAGSSAQGVGSAEPRDYTLGPNEFLLLNSIADELLGSHRLQEVTGDLRQMEADFQIISGDGSVILFTSSVDNRTGDSIIRVQ